MISLATACSDRAMFSWRCALPRFPRAPGPVDAPTAGCGTVARSGALVPAHADALFVMQKVVEVQLEGIAHRPDDSPEQVEKLRLAIRGQPHHLVFVSVMRETKIHRDRRVQESEGMRVEDPVLLDPFGSPAVDRQGAGEVAHAVDREHGGLFVGRNQEAGRHVRLMVLDAMELGLEVRLRHPGGLRELVLQGDRLALPPHAVQQRSQRRPVADHEADPLPEIRPRIERYSHVVQVACGNSTGLQAPANRLGGKAGPVLDAVECSSSTAATSLPSISSAADASPW